MSMAKDEYKSPLVLIGEGESFQDELCRMIESSRMFADFSRPEVQIIAGYSHAYEVAPGETIFREGDKGQFMCLIVEGKVNVLKDTGVGMRKVITTARAGQTMGEMSLLDDLPYSATATAKDLTKLVLITRHNFERLTDANPVLGVKILKKIARLMSLRLRQTTGVLLDHLE
jgi:CRP/FNR family cyclic AMP-dependent transcriptional regulator